MTPYALASLPAMLGIRAGSKVSVINPPRGFVQKLNPLPDGVEFLITAVTGLDVILFFTEDPQELVQRLPALARAMALTGGIWVCWPGARVPAGTSPRTSSATRPWTSVWWTTKSASSTPPGQASGW